MNPLAVFAGASESVVPLTARPRIWFPFFVLAIVQLLALALLVSFYRPIFLPLVLPFLKSVGGEPMVHYPFFFYGLPTAFLRTTLVLAVVLESFTVAVATLLFARAFTGESHRGAWAHTARRYPALLVLGLIVVGLSYGLSLLFGLVPAEAFAGSPLVRWGSRMGMIALNALLQTFLAFTTAWVVIEGYGPFSAVRKSIVLGLRAFLPAFLMILAASLLLFPFDYLSGRPDLIVEKLRPETVSWLLGLRSLTQILIGFFLTGGITYIFIWKRGEVS